MPWLTSASKQPLLLALLGGALVATPVGWWVQTEAPWARPLYCIEQPGMLWGGLAPLPPDFTPQCPQNASYRQEVRAGESRVEQYLVPGWHPRAAAQVLATAGYILIDDELSASNHYSAFLGRITPAELHYTAIRQAQNTLITISGSPAP